MVPLSKITGYLLNPSHEVGLNPSHEVGAPKAVFFKRHGFSILRADQIATALAGHPDRNAVEAVTEDRWGKRYVVRCGGETPDGLNPCIRSVWIVRVGEDVARLVTAYPA